MVRKVWRRACRVSVQTRVTELTLDQLLEVYGEQCVGIQASEVYLAQASAVYVVLIYSFTE